MFVYLKKVYFCKETLLSTLVWIYYSFKKKSMKKQFQNLVFLSILMIIAIPFFIIKMPICITRHSTFLHFLFYLTLSAFIVGFMRYKVFFILSIFIFGICIEILQSKTYKILSSYHRFDYDDILTNTKGIIVGFIIGFVIYLINKLRKHQKKFDGNFYHTLL